MVQTRLSKSMSVQRVVAASAASHGMQLPFDQTAGRAFDAGVRILQHKLGELFGRKCSHVLFLGLFENRPDTAEWVGEDQTGVHPVGHDLVKPLAKTFDRLQTAFRFDWTKQSDHHRRGDFREWSRLQIGEHMQRERPPDVLCVGRG